MVNFLCRITRCCFDLNLETINVNSHNITTLKNKCLRPRLHIEIAETLIFYFATHLNPLLIWDLEFIAP